MLMVLILFLQNKNHIFVCKFCIFNITKKARDDSILYTINYWFKNPYWNFKDLSEPTRITTTAFKSLLCIMLLSKYSKS